MERGKTVLLSVRFFGLEQDVIAFQSNELGEEIFALNSDFAVNLARRFHVIPFFSRMPASSRRRLPLKMSAFSASEIMAPSTFPHSVPRLRPGR